MFVKNLASHFPSKCVHLASSFYIVIQFALSINDLQHFSWL